MVCTKCTDKYMLQECRPCVPIREQNSTENYKTWNNAVQVATCRSWAVKVTQDWSISWMAKCMPYGIVLLPECLSLQMNPLHV